MHVTKPTKVGGSVMLAMPPAILDFLHLGAGVPVSVGVEDGRLVVAAQRGPRSALADPLSQYDPGAETSAGDRNWTASGPVGGDILRSSG